MEFDQNLIDCPWNIIYFDHISPDRSDTQFFDQIGDRYILTLFDHEHMVSCNPFYSIQMAIGSTLGPLCRT